MGKGLGAEDRPEQVKQAIAYLVANYQKTSEAVLEPDWLERQIESTAAEVQMWPPAWVGREKAEPPAAPDELQQYCRDLLLPVLKNMATKPVPWGGWDWPRFADRLEELLK